MQIPPITRAQLFLGATMGIGSCFQFLFNSNDNVANIPPSTSIFHEPPPGITGTNYSDNPTVFGKILRGELPCRIYQESSELLAFRDRSPKAKLHALVIPKNYVQNVYALTPDDVHLVQDMRQMGMEILEREQPQALSTNDYILCFHIPPFNSVDHLHLHVLAPASEMNMIYRYGKYAVGARWCSSDLEVIDRLKGGQTAVPYKQQLF